MTYKALTGLDTHNSGANLGFKAFLRFFNTTLDKYAPIKELTKKRRKR